MTAPLRFRRRCRAAGLSLLEVLIGLAITAMLFTSLVFAIQTSITSERANSEYARNIQTARAMLYTITREIRTAVAADVENGVVNGKSKKGKNFIIQCAAKDGVAPAPVAYRWDNSRRELIRYNDASENGASPAHGKGKAAGNLKDVEVKALLADDPDSPGSTITTKVTISVVVGDGANQVTLTATASPRRTVPVY